jgi:hypothetical protein
MAASGGSKDLLLGAAAGVACIVALFWPVSVTWPRVFLPAFFAWLCADRMTAWAMAGKPARPRLRWLRLQALAALAFGVVAVVAGYEVLSGGDWRWYDLTGALAGACIGLFGLGVLLTARVVRRVVRRGPATGPTGPEMPERGRAPGP